MGQAGGHVGHRRRRLIWLRRLGLIGLRLRRLGLPALALVVATVAAGCGDGEGSSDAPDGAALLGREFSSTEVLRPDGAPEPLFDGVTVTVRFDDDGSNIGLHAACNQLGAEAEISGDVIEVGDIATTEMGCPGKGHEQDQWLSELMFSSPTWTLDGHRLELRGEPGTLRLSDGRDAPTVTSTTATPETTATPPTTGASDVTGTPDTTATSPATRPSTRPTPAGP